MPGFDNKGPMGQGPRTGGGFGKCGGAVNVERLEDECNGEPRGIGRGGQPRGGDAAGATGEVEGDFGAEVWGASNSTTKRQVPQNLPNR